jgi:ADP-heptose:LPS heptosyltransferase
MPPPRKVMIYRLGSLGDTVVALPCFHLIRMVFPNSRITLLTNHPVSGKAAPAMAVLQDSGLCDEAVNYPVGIRRAHELARVRRTIHESQPDVLINLASGRGLFKSLRDHVFFLSCGVKRIIGTPLRRRDLRVQKMKEGEFEPESQRLAGRLAPLGTVDLADPRFWQLKLTKAERDQALDLLPAQRTNFLAVSVGTKVPVKDWGEENWGNLLTLLAREMRDATLVLLGSADEWKRSEKLSQRWRGGCTNCCGKIPPRISAAILEHCRLFIGHDSGPMHLSSVVGVPTLGLFSWLNPPGQWFPGHRSWPYVKVLYPALPQGGWKPKLQMKQGAAEGIKLLQPKEVFQSAAEMWRRTPDSAANMDGCRA